MTNLVEYEKKVSNEDFKKMIKKFELQEKKEKQHFEKQKKIKEFNQKWKSTIDKINVDKNEDFEELRQDFEEKMYKKEKSLEKLIKKRQKSKKSVETYNDVIVEQNLQNLQRKEEFKRDVLITEIFSKINKIDLNNKENLKLIKNKFENRNHSYSVKARHHQIENQKEDNIYEKELRMKPLQRYEKRFLNLHSSISIQPKKEDHAQKMQKVIENIEDIEKRRKEKSLDVFKKLQKADKINHNLKKHNSDEMRQKLEKLKNRTERVLQRKYNNELQKMNDNEKYLDKQFKKSQIAQSIESLNNGKVNALHVNYIRNQIINKKNVNNYLKIINDLQHRNVSLKNQDEQKRIYHKIKQKEIHEKLRLERLKRKQESV